MLADWKNSARKRHVESFNKDTRYSSSHRVSFVFKLCEGVSYDSGQTLIAGWHFYDNFPESCRLPV